VFPVRYELNFYILLRRNSVLKGLRLVQSHPNTPPEASLAGCDFLADPCRRRGPTYATCRGNRKRCAAAVCAPVSLGGGGQHLPAGSYTQLEELSQWLPADRVKMFAGVWFVTVTVILACCRDISGQRLAFGKCPSYPAMKKLDLKKVGNRKLVYHSCMVDHSMKWSRILPYMPPPSCSVTGNCCLITQKGCFIPLRPSIDISRSNWLGGMIRVTCGDNENDINGLFSRKN
jgi:hypothetical protein